MAVTISAIMLPREYAERVGFLGKRHEICNQALLDLLNWVGRSSGLAAFFRFGRTAIMHSPRIERLAVVSVHGVGPPLHQLAPGNGFAPGSQG